MNGVDLFFVLFCFFRFISVCLSLLLLLLLILMLVLDFLFSLLRLMGFLFSFPVLPNSTLSYMGFKEGRGRQGINYFSFLKPSLFHSLLLPFLSILINLLLLVLR